MTNMLGGFMTSQVAALVMTPRSVLSRVIFLAPPEGGTRFTILSSPNPTCSSYAGPSLPAGFGYGVLWPIVSPALWP